jgi:hypothetical protein
MADAPDPPPRTFTFKPKEFERVNAPRPEAGEPAAPPPPANDVFALQQQIRAREIASGRDELAPAGRPRSNKRARDYWLLLLAVDLPLLALGWFNRTDLVTLVLVGSAFTLFTIWLTWTMWVVGDRY